jgi:hypothetical protein
VWINSTVFEDNRATVVSAHTSAAVAVTIMGGAIRAESCSALSVRNSAFLSNVAYADGNRANTKVFGGAMYVVGANITAVATRFVRNAARQVRGSQGAGSSAAWGGAVFFSGSGTPLYYFWARGLAFVNNVAFSQLQVGVGLHHGVFLPVRALPVCGCIILLVCDCGNHLLTGCGWYCTLARDVAT